MRTLNRKQSREVDRRAIHEFGIPGVVLMENAGRGVADKLCELGASQPGGSHLGQVVICCGKGNNGGDGFVIARHLDLRGHKVQVLLWAEPSELQGDAETNFKILQKCGIPIDILSGDLDAKRLEKQFDQAAWLVDALLGTGARGEPRPPYGEVINQMNQHPSPILAVDLPSGLDCDTGQAARSTIRAAHTCTFLAVKPGFLKPGADQYTGQVHVLDIGFKIDD